MSSSKTNIIFEIIEDEPILKPYWNRDENAGPCEDCGEQKELEEDRICHKCFHSSVPKGECWCDLQGNEPDECGDDEESNDEDDDEDDDEEEGWHCCKCKQDFKESEVEHIEEVDDAVCKNCCIKYGFNKDQDEDESVDSH